MAREAVYQQSHPETPGEIPGDIGGGGQPPVQMSGEAGGPMIAKANLGPGVWTKWWGSAMSFERLKIAIQAATGRDEPLGHILFDGPPGLGKTTFATVIPAEMGTTVQMANGAGLSAPKDLLPYLTNVSAKSVLFIDEIHRVPKAVEEYLYTAMEDFRIDIVLGEGVNARTLNFELQPFTLIGATTRAGMLSAPLRDRFQIREHLGWYTEDQLRNSSCETQRNWLWKSTIPQPAKSLAAVAARLAWPTIACTGYVTTPKSKRKETCPSASHAMHWT